MPRRPCLTCGALGSGSYCPRHRPRSPSSQNRSGAWHRLRALALNRDGRRCRRCGSPHRLQVHHRISRSEGGPNALSNLVTECERCHRLEHGMHPPGGPTPIN